MIIGKFTTHETGHVHGHIVSPYGYVTADLMPSGSQPDYIGAKGVDFVLVSDENTELGCGWKKKSKDGKEYVSIRLDGFNMPEPINCALFPTGDEQYPTYVLVWRRDDRKPA